MFQIYIHVKKFNLSMFRVFVQIFGILWLTPKAPRMTKNDKNCVLCNFCCQTFDKLRGLECWKRLKTKKSLSKRPNLKESKQFFREKCFELWPKQTKIPKISNILRFFLQFSSNFRQTRWLRTLKFSTRMEFFQEVLKTVFEIEKCLKLKPNFTKNPKLP